jgi:hypothetical protein
VAHNKIIFHNSSISEDGLIEHAHSFIVSKVNKVSAMNFNLSVTGVRTTDRSNRVDSRSLVVKVWNSRGPEIIFQGNLKINETRLLISRRNTFNLTGRQEFTVCLFPAKITLNVSSVFKT